MKNKKCIIAILILVTLILLIYFNNLHLFIFNAARQVVNQPEIVTKNESFDYLNNKFCKLSSYSLDNITQFEPRKNHVKNITLLVTFNILVREINIITIFHIYRSYFNKIVFCGKDEHNPMNNYQYIKLDTVNGYFHYYCMNKAIEMNLATEGILLMSDDILLKYWRLDTLDSHKIWFPFVIKNICIHDIYKENPKLSSWMWWQTDMGVNAILNLWEYFDQVQKNLTSIDKENLNVINNYLNKLEMLKDKKSNYTRVCAQGTGSDIFYLNAENFKRFHYISSLFRQFNVFLEIAVPTILVGIENDDSLLIGGTYSWPDQIDLNSYEKLGYFAHPVKISQYYNTRQGRIFCEKFIKEKFQNS